MTPDAEPRRGGIGLPGLATLLAWIVYGAGAVLGLVTLFTAGLAGEQRTALVSLGIFVGSAVLAGTLLAIARDGRGGRTRWWQVAILPLAAIAVEYALASIGSGSGPLPVSTLLAFAGFFLLVSGMPLIAAFMATRGLARLFGGASR
jgi:hypothetical protein